MTEFTNLNRQTYDALNGSVRKWWGIAFGGKRDLADKDCPLCALYNKTACQRGCPIVDRSGYIYCSWTPYRAFHQAIHQHGQKHPRTLRAAQKFYYWLLALRDEYREQLDASRLVVMPAEHAAPYEGVIAVDEADDDDRLDMVKTLITSKILESNISIRPITQPQFDNLPVKGGVRQCPSGYDYTDVSFGGVPAKVDAPAIVDGRFFEKGHAFIGGKID